jgi:hypothetical protein
MVLGKGNTPGATNAAEVQIPAILFCVVAPLFIGIRFWSRLTQSSGLGADDWTILGSLVFTSARSCSQTILTITDLFFISFNTHAPL